MTKSSLLKNSVIGLLCILSLSYSPVASQLILKKGAPHVKTEQGFFIGSVKTSRGGQSYYEFLGLRYANPPKRFQPPEPYTGDDVDPNEVQKAMTPGSKCPQQFGRVSSGEEDCLYLNVNVPMKPAPDERGFPVMVWLHGGSFSFGSGDGYEPKYLMDEDIIVVTFNYRLGVFGFISTGDEQIPGNMGLKDQVACLKWIQQNIKHFKGDNKKITIIGNSAGSASVHYLILSPIAKGLFQSAIAQSGSAHNFWAYSHKPAATAFEFGKSLECDITSSKTLVECLKEKTVQELISAQAKLKTWYIDPMVSFGPTVEVYDAKDGSNFLPEHPDKIVERRAFSRVPLMLGLNQDEGLSINAVGVLHSEKLSTDLNTEFEKYAPITLNFGNLFPSSTMTELCKEIKEYYFGDKLINKSTIQNLTNLYSDANFVYGVWKFALEHATEQPVYPYLLTFQDDSSSSITKFFTGSDTKYGVAHGDDIQFLFKSVLFPDELPKGSEAEKFSKHLVKLWVSFATHRKPTELWGSEKEWPPISKAQLQGNKPFAFLQLDKDTSIVKNPFLTRIKFWDRILKKYSSPNVKVEL